MKIGNIIDSLPPDKSGSGASVSGGSGARKSAATPATSASAESEKINLSPLSTQLNSLETDLKGGAAFDARRVAEIKQSIEEGGYKINPEAIADRMISNALDMSKPKNG